MSVYMNHLDKMKEKWERFIAEAETGNTNKSAALRARRLSLELRNDLKDFKSISTKHDRGEL